MAKRRRTRKKKRISVFPSNLPYNPGLNMNSEIEAQPSVASTLNPRRRALPRLQEAGLFVVIIILGLLFTGVGHFRNTPGQPNPFLNVDNLVNFIATPMSIYAIMAVGQTAVIITGGIDISVGSIFVLAGLGTAGVLQYMDQDAPAWKVLPLALASPWESVFYADSSTACSPPPSAWHPFIVTLGTLSIFRGPG